MIIRNSVRSSGPVRRRFLPLSLSLSPRRARVCACPVACPPGSCCPRERDTTDDENGVLSCAVIPSSGPSLRRRRESPPLEPWCPRPLATSERRIVTQFFSPANHVPRRCRRAPVSRSAFRRTSTRHHRGGSKHNNVYAQSTSKARLKEKVSVRQRLSDSALMWRWRVLPFNSTPFRRHPSTASRSPPHHPVLFIILKSL